MNKVALVTGASRGIGRVICHKLAENGYNVVITAKSTENNLKLPGTIFSVDKEIREKYNVDSMPLKMDVRSCSEMKNTVDTVINNFGRIDVLINNAGALWWKDIINTTPEKYDLINDINVRSSFVLSHLCMPHMEKQGSGHIIMHSPPFDEIKENKTYKNKTGYMISKYGMTMTAMGISEEFFGKGIAANTIWPATPIKSFATKNNNMGTEKHWRRPDIIADAILEIIKEDPNEFTGRQLIDEDYLRSKGVVDFTKYRCIENYEPPKLNDIFLL
jgi:citronellol/citronellal dehydrogenase